jgi:hypothetical protein
MSSRTTAMTTTDSDKQRGRGNITVAGWHDTGTRLPCLCKYEQAIAIAIRFD